MDALDIKLLRLIGVQPFLRVPYKRDAIKPSALARKLGVTTETVRERLQRLADAGIVEGLVTFPNWRLLGYELTTVHFRVPATAKKAEAVKAAQEVGDLFCIGNFAGPDVCIDIPHRSPEDLARRTRLLSKLMGGATPQTLLEYELPTVQRALTPLDWKVLRAFRGDADRNLNEVAGVLGVSAKTVQRHLDRLADEGALDVVAWINPHKMSGLVPFLLVLDLASRPTPTERAALLRAFDESWFYQGSGAADNPKLALFMVAATTGEVEELRARGEALAGVRNADALIVASQWGSQDWITEALAQKIQMSEPAIAIR